MSADNYWIIRKAGDKFVPVHAFMSDDLSRLPTARDKKFDSFNDAYEYAVKLDRESPTEYGVMIHQEALRK